MRLLFSCLLVAHLLVPAPALAQDIAALPPPAEVPECRPLDEALGLALARSPRIQLANADRQRAEADLRDARSVTRPQVSTFLRTQAGDNNLTGTGVENSAGLRVSQRLFDFGVSRLERRAAELSVEARGFDAISVENQTALDTALAYIGVAEIAARLDVTAKREAFFERERASTAIALDLGGATKSDLAEVSARLADASADRLELEFQRDRFAASLARETGTAIAPCEASLDTLGAASAEGIVETIENALETNPRIRAASLELEAQELRVKRARRNRLPAIDVVAIGSYAQDNVGNNSFGFRERIGIDVTIPLLSGGRLAADQQRSRADALARSSEVAQLRLELAESVEVSVRRIASLRMQLRHRSEVVARQEEQFDAATAEFEEGLRTLPELVEDRLELEQVRINAIATRFALIREVVQLRALSGDLAAELPVNTAFAYGPRL